MDPRVSYILVSENQCEVWWSAGGIICNEKYLFLCWVGACQCVNPESLQVCHNFSEWGRDTVDDTILTTLCLPGTERTINIMSSIRIPELEIHWM